ncbi:MFS transporter [Pseudoalteromonas ulvae]|uniref:MFS transporter n=1 Tax=Pseudoalteromonas ulvae TaxID=107327 RepID=A0A244CPH9_PSEDV|nr:MFS transporter [Pseudoalteromonas ulvae]OUL57510.1 MFS transporter [Pseudoalteromonas ulvae]
MRFYQLLISSVVIFFVLYAPQPLMPLLSLEFNVSAASAGSLMTATMIPLAIAPLIYGFVLAKENPLKILKLSMIGLALTCLLVPFITEFNHFFIIRICQGLLLPAALTSMTTYIACRYQGLELQKKMGIYIASTIAGGFFGRVISASFAEFFTWQDFYLVIAVTLFVLAGLIRIKKQLAISATSSVFSHLKDIQNPTMLKTYGAVFCMFFCFAAILNYLPFILRDKFDIQSTQQIGFVYIGYLLGALASLLSPWLVKTSANTFKLLTYVFLFYSCSILLMIPADLISFMVAFTFFCSAMFIIHSTTAPLINKISPATPSVTNGVYVSFYYCGGALGSYFPGLIYQHWGALYFLLAIVLVCLIGGGLIYSARSGTEITATS